MHEHKTHFGIRILEIMMLRFIFNGRPVKHQKRGRQTDRDITKKTSIYKHDIANKWKEPPNSGLGVRTYPRNYSALSLLYI